MAIITTSEVKALLQITSTSTDTLIDTLIPIVTMDVHDYTKNYFKNYRTEIKSHNFSFNGTASTLTSDDYDFDDDYGYSTGQDVVIQGSFKNNGVFTIESVSANVITFASSSIYTIETESEEWDAQVSICKIDYPKSLQLVVARMINYHLQTNKDNVKSETISRYSITYNNDSMVNGYPSSIISGLNRWRRVTFN